MKQLIVYSHPNPLSFNHAILETLTGALKAQGDEVVVRDLYALKFDPVLKAADFEAIQQGSVTGDVKVEQDHIRWADVITFIFPVWWASMPAITKGYIDRVFSHGFAYSYSANGPQGLLGGKKVMVITTQGAPEAYYAGNGMLQSMSQTIDEGIFKFCALELLGHRAFGEVPSTTPENRAKMLTEVTQMAATLK